MTSQRVVRKSLAGEEDLLFGEGTVTQSRSGQDYDITKIRTIRPVNSLAELNALDTEQFKKAQLYQGSVVIDYSYDGTSWVALECSPLATVADMVAVPELQAGLIVNTVVHNTTSNAGGATYLVKTVAQALADGDTIDEIFVISLANSNVAVIQDNPASFYQAGAIGNGEVDDTTLCQAAVDKYKSPIMGKGLFLIDPSVALKVRYGTTIRGEGQSNSGFLAKFGVAGSVIHREFNPGVANDRVQNVLLEDFSIFLNHVHQASEPANIQQGFNFRDIGRSTIKNCYAGNYKDPNDNGVGALANSLYPNAAGKTQAMRGYPFVLGNRSVSDIDYAGGEVNKIINCRAWWARKGITIDDEDLTGGVSASYQAIVKGCDIQTVERGITQGSQFNVGCTFEDNLIQDVQQAAGSANTTFVYKLTGCDNIIKGGYVETPEANLTACVWLQTTAINNTVLPFYHDVPDAKFLLDSSSVGSQNFVRQITENDTFLETIGGVNIDQTRTKAKVSFDAAGAIVDNMNVTSVQRNGVGDFTILVPTNIGVTEETQAVVTILSNVSGNVTASTVRTVSPSGNDISFRIRTWNVNTSADEDFPKVWVSFKG